MDETLLNMFVEMREFICVRLTPEALPPELQDEYRELREKLVYLENNYMQNFHIESSRPYCDSLLISSAKSTLESQQGITGNYPIIVSPLGQSIQHLDDHIYEKVEDVCFRFPSPKVRLPPSCNKAVQTSPDSSNRESYMNKKKKKLLVAFSKLRGHPSTGDGDEARSPANCVALPKSSLCPWNGELYVFYSKALSATSATSYKGSNESIYSSSVPKPPSTCQLSFHGLTTDVSEKSGFRASLKRISGRRKRNLWCLRTCYIVWRPDAKLLLFKPSRHSLPELDSCEFRVSHASDFDVRGSVFYGGNQEEGSLYHEGVLDLELFFSDIKEITAEKEDSEGREVIRISRSQENLPTIFLVPRKASEFDTLEACLRHSLSLEKDFLSGTDDYVRLTISEPKKPTVTESVGLCESSFTHSKELCNTSSSKITVDAQPSSNDSSIRRKSRPTPFPLSKKHTRESASSQKQAPDVSSSKQRRFASFINDYDVSFLKTKMPFSTSSAAPSSTTRSSSFLLSSSSTSTRKHKNKMLQKTGKLFHFLPDKLRKQSSSVNRRMPLYGGHKGTLVPVNPFEISMQGKLLVRSPIYKLSGTSMTQSVWQKDLPKTPLLNSQTSSLTSSIFQNSKLSELFSLSPRLVRRNDRTNKPENASSVALYNEASAKWYHRYCLLSRGMFSVFHMPRKGNQELLVEISMASCYVTYDESDLARDKFRFVIGEGLRTLLILEAGDQIEYVNWVTALTKAIPKTLTPNNRTTRQSLFNTSNFKDGRRVRIHPAETGGLRDLEEVDSSSLEDINIQDSGLYEIAARVINHSANTLESIHGKKCQGRKHLTMNWREKTSTIVAATYGKPLPFGRSLSLSVLMEESKVCQVRQRAKLHPLLGNYLSSSESSSDQSTPRDGSCPSFPPDLLPQCKMGHFSETCEMASPESNRLQQLHASDEDDASPRIELPSKAPKRTPSNEFSLQRIFSRKSSMISLTSWINRSVRSSPAIPRRTSGAPLERHRDDREASSRVSIALKEEEDSGILDTTTSSHGNLSERNGMLGSFRNFGDFFKRKKVRVDFSPLTKSPSRSPIHSSFSSISTLSTEQREDLPSSSESEDNGTRTLMPEQVKQYLNSVKNQTDLTKT